MWNNYQTDGPISTKFGTHVRIYLGMDIGQKQLAPRDTRGAFGGVLGGQKFKHLDNLPNGWTDWHQIWYTPADSSGNGHRLNTISPSIPQWAEPSIPQVAGASKFHQSLRNAMICTEKIKINYMKMKCTN